MPVLVRSQGPRARGRGGGGRLAAADGVRQPNRDSSRSRERRRPRCNRDCRRGARSAPGRSRRKTAVSGGRAAGAPHRQSLGSKYIICRATRLLLSPSRWTRCQCAWLPVVGRRHRPRAEVPARNQQVQRRRPLQGRPGRAGYTQRGISISVSGPFLAPRTTLLCLVKPARPGWGGLAKRTMRNPYEAHGQPPFGRAAMGPVTRSPSPPPLC